MNEDRFNMDIRKFLKVVGVTSQREIENACVMRSPRAGSMRPRCSSRASPCRFRSSGSSTSSTAKSGSPSKPDLVGSALLLFPVFTIIFDRLGLRPAISAAA